MKMESTKPISNILSYRSHIMLFSALWILCSHSVGTIGEEQWNFLLKFKPIIAFGWGGVDIFLFLSGLGIGLSLTKKQTFSTFISKRFKRIFFPFFIMVTVEHIINQTQTIAYLLDITTISYWLPLIGEHSKNTFWYISAAFAFYIFSYPYYKYFFQKKPLISTIIVSVIGLLLYRLLFGKIDFFLARVPIYFIGMYVSRLVDKSFNPTPFILLSGITYCGMSLAAWKFGGLILSSMGLHFILFIIITPGLIFLLGKIFKFLDGLNWGTYLNKLFNFMGNYSLEIYLVHWSFLCMIQKFNWDISWGVFLGISMLSSFLVKFLATQFLIINKKLYQI